MRMNLPNYHPSHSELPQGQSGYRHDSQKQQPKRRSRFQLCLEQHSEQIGQDCALADDRHYRLLRDWMLGSQRDALRGMLLRK